MNWKEIKEQYPKAHKSLIDWMDDDYCDIDFEFVNDSWKGALLEPYTWKDRDLYDFFDKKGILIFIKRSGISSNANDYTFVIDSYNNGIYSGFEPIIPLCNRKGTEQSAFEKAFESLEYNIAKGTSKVIASIFNPHGTRPQIINREIEVETNRKLW